MTMTRPVVDRAESGADQKANSVAGRNSVQKIAVRLVGRYALFRFLLPAEGLPPTDSSHRAEIFDFQKLILNCSTGPQE